MISAKPMAMVAMLALAGAAVAQEEVDERTLPPDIQLLLEVSGQRPLGDRIAQVVETLTSLDATLRAEPAKLDGRSRAYANLMRGLWEMLLPQLASDYRGIRHDGGDVPLAMMQLFLLTHMSCLAWEQSRTGVRRGHDVLSRGEYGDLADELLLTAKTPQQTLLGHLYKLHEGDKNARIRHALILGQMKGLATEVVPHLIEELVDEDMRLVQETITALGMIGPAAKDAIPTLEKLTEHDDPQIAERAKAALRQMRGR